MAGKTCMLGDKDKNPKQYSGVRQFNFSVGAGTLHHMGKQSPFEFCGS